jgi:hypothetical protein
MRDKIKNAALHHAAAGLSVMPTINDKKGKPKKPAVSGWEDLQAVALSQEELSQLFAGHAVRKKSEQDEGIKPYGAIAGLALICGDVSGGVELIDVDSAKDPHGTIWDDLRNAIAYDDLIAGIFKELYIEKTVSGGYHILYRYQVPEGRTRAGNMKLAQAARTAAGTSGEAIIETRGEGGYCVIAPTPGYETVQGDLQDLPIIELAERDRLIEICKGLSYEIAPEAPAAVVPTPIRRQADGLSPFDDYNARATLDTVAEILQAHRWTIAGRRPEKIFIRRPDNGTVTSEQSGNITMISGPQGSVALLSVFSSNAAPFDPYNADGTKKAYRPHDVYTLLEHAGDYKAAAKTLYRAGYGDRRSQAVQLDAEEITVTYENKVNKENKVTSVTSDEMVTLCTPGGQPLTREDVLAAPVDVFTLSAGQDTPEIVQAIYLIHAAKKYAYIQLPDDSGKLSEIRDYRYLAQRLIEQRDGMDLTDRDIDELRLDIVSTSRRLRIHDRHKFQGLCLEYGAADVGISQDDLQITAQELDAADRKETDKKKIEASLQKAQELIAAGKPYEAAKHLQPVGNLTDTRADLSSLLAPMTEERLRNEIQAQAGDVPCGYSFFKDGKPLELELPGAALSVIAARTGHRKTSLLLNMAVNIARNPAVHGDVYFLTYEETAADLTLKLMTLDINSKELDYIKKYYRKGMPQDNFIDAAFRAGKDNFMRELIEPGRLRVMYPGLPAPELCSMIRLLKQEGRVAAVFIDYIQQLRIPELASQSRQAQLQEICEQLRDTAISTGLPLILGAQFNREVNQEGDIESSKIREAGDIEQTANLVIGLWDRAQTREGQKNRQQKAAKNAPGELYAEILKGRGIGTGADAVLKYNAKTWKIEKN